MRVSKNNVAMGRASLVLFLAGLMSGATLHAADVRKRDAGVNARQHNQQHRVRQGVRTGELTRRETGALAREQRDVRQLERAYKSDGELTRAERVDLRQEQNRASRHIYNQRHDAQTRPVDQDARGQ